MNPKALSVILITLAFSAGLSTGSSIPEWDAESLLRRNYVTNMTKFAWDNYKKYAWGFNELAPLRRAANFEALFGHDSHLGLTIIDSLDTLYIMGLQNEYELGKRWIIDNIINRPDFQLDQEASMFELNIRLVGGLLSLHSLTKDQIFLDSALKVASTFLPAFDTPTGLPFNHLEELDESCKLLNGDAQRCCKPLADLGTLSLEFQYLSDQTGIPVFGEKIKAVDSALKHTAGPSHLYPTKVNVYNGNRCNNVTSIGSLGDSFYEYLLKYWIYTGKKDSKLLKDYLEAMNGIKKNLIRVSSDGFVYIGELSYGYLDPKMSHLACFAGGLFALTAMHTKGFLSDLERSQYATLAEEVTRTCRESYVQTATGLGPEDFYFASETGDKYAQGIRSSSRGYILRPEVVESYFYLWRMTKDQKYRDWAWDAVQAIEKHCKTDNGYSGISNVYDASPRKDDVQQSFFLAETLKYLYLIFSDDDVIPLDKFVFNTEAHPLLIRNS